MRSVAVQCAGVLAAVLGTTLAQAGTPADEVQRCSAILTALSQGNLGEAVLQMAADARGPIMPAGRAEMKRTLEIARRSC